MERRKLGKYAPMSGSSAPRTKGVLGVMLGYWEISVEVGIPLESTGR